MQKNNVVMGAWHFLSLWNVHSYREVEEESTPQF